MSSSYRFTCNSCELAFTASQDQREHMKTEWHRYNLKRRVAQLPPISEDTFDTKVATLADKKDDEEEDEYCTKKEQRKKAKEELLEKKRQLFEIARKRMTSTGGTVKIGEDGKLVMENKSTEAEERKIILGMHKDEETILGEEANMTEEELEEKMLKEKMENRVEIPLDTCIFCGAKSKDLDTNVEHMFMKHGLYIPEEEYLVNKEGLIEYLGEKVGYGNVCLVCNYQGRNLESIRQHMLAKSHCKIPYETEDEKYEIGKFYDFSSTYSKKTKEEDNDENDDDEWEDVSNDYNVDDDEEEEEEKESGKFANADDVIYASEIGLHLPNGLVAGHRSLARVWRQNLAPERELGEGQGTVMAAETRHLATQFEKKQYKEQKRVWARENKAKNLNDRSLAKFINVKPHFRDELLQ
ncbi:hypothetical protein FOA43_000621 [Brettanomyces nanus]|uniref:C2H2-type domain-containing protein n=1 Tax=Eeniella nana TaxID=13502 RepID=A0A875RW25_EENNA|nr:uncharacterized protein FOA43_000621 [Brettanomyces nanus]QPG73311.1 hypothetical protein FOA43_000621 [Brettanomyces nanus]